MHHLSSLPTSHPFYQIYIRSHHPLLALGNHTLNNHHDIRYKLIPHLHFLHSHLQKQPLSMFSF